MPKRICSKCNNPLGDADHFFCSSCGVQLEDTLTLPVNITKVTYFTRTNTGLSNLLDTFHVKYSEFRAKHLTTKNLVIGGGLVFGILAGVGLLFGLEYLGVFSFTGSKTSEKPLQNEIVYSNVLDLDLAAGSFVFGADRIMEYVPGDAVIYVEGFGLSSFLESYTNDTGFFPETLSEFALNVSDHFALFAIPVDDGISWGVIIIPKPDFVLDNLEVYSGYARIINGKLVVVEDEKLLDMVLEASDELALNFSQSKVYAQAKTKFPKDGQILFIFSDDSSKQQLTDKAEALNSEFLKSLVEQVNNSGYNELVIRKSE